MLFPLFWLLWIVLLWIILYKFSCGPLFSHLWSIYLGVKLLGHMVTLFNFWGTARLFSKEAVLFCFPTNSGWGFWLLHTLGTYHGFFKHQTQDFLLLISLKKEGIRIFFDSPELICLIRNVLVCCLRIKNQWTWKIKNWPLLCMGGEFGR